jgi:hypothetical protein
MYDIWQRVTSREEFRHQNCQYCHQTMSLTSRINVWAHRYNILTFKCEACARNTTESVKYG